MKCIARNFTRYFISEFSTSNVRYKKEHVRLKVKGQSSQDWLRRQMSDPYVEKAKMANYRCRSAFKLIEIDEKFKLLSAGLKVVDCGAAPGSWTQVCVQRINADKKDINKPVGHVVGVDRLPIYPILGATLLGNTDFTYPETEQKLVKMLDSPVDLVISDMAPNATGVRSLDQENIIALAYSVLRFAVKISKPISANLLVKVWQGGQVSEFFSDCSRFYEKVQFVKPKASRTDSAEVFILAKRFKGLKTS